ncbi:MAG: cytochrome-c peroxidase [Planctomycetota bacterium]
MSFITRNRRGSAAFPVVAWGLLVTLMASAAVVLVPGPASPPAPDEDKSNPHAAQTAPLSKAQLEARKNAAHELSRKSSGDWKLRHSDSFAAGTLTDYVRDPQTLKALGKALFWDQRVGSDDRTACATCHYHAGVDTRTKHTDNALVPGQLRANHQWTRADHSSAYETGKSADFGLITAKDGDDDQTRVIGSQGIRLRIFEGLTQNAEGIPVEKSRMPTQVELQSLHYPETLLPYRSVSRRNAGTVINSTLLSRLFHDGRAADEFNGHDGYGNQSLVPDEIGKFIVRNRQVTTLRVRIPRAAAASQSVVPLVSDQEMSWHGRRPWHVALKLLDTPPLLLQDVHKEDSLLAPWTHQDQQKSLNTTYRKLIEQAFLPALWQAPDSFQLNPSFTTIDGQPLKGSTAMHAANFSLFFGLAIMAYEQTLISDDSPWDKYANGDTTAMSLTAITGMEKFRSYGCGDCHMQPEFAGAAIAAVFGDSDPPDDDYDELPPGIKPLTQPVNPDGNKFIEQLKPVFEGPGEHLNKQIFAYDGGFYNIGVTSLWFNNQINTPVARLDWGVGRVAEPNEIPFEFSRARKRYPGEDRLQPNQSHVRGAFKSPSLRNIALTSPYMHNGAFLTLREVLLFYQYGPREFADIAEAKFWHHPGLPALQQFLEADVRAIDEIEAFLMALTDSRVELHQAPFDHPSLVLPSGNKVQSAYLQETVNLKNSSEQLKLRISATLQRRSEVNPTNPYPDAGDNGLDDIHFLQAVGRNGVTDPLEGLPAWHKLPE